MKKHKLSLDSLKVKSFITGFNFDKSATVKGGLAANPIADRPVEETRWCSNWCSEPGVGCTR